MAQHMERPRVTEIQVRMDCNGCVQKVKKALHSIHGISDLYIDFPQQKITIVGSADPERIVKALKKTRKSAIICSHIEQADPPTNEPEEPAPSETEEAPHNNPPTDAPPAEAVKPPEPPKEPPKDPPSQENQSAENEKQTNQDADSPKNQPDQPSKPRDVEEVHVIYHYPPDYGGYRYNNFGQGMSSHEPPPRDPGYRYNNYGQNIIHEPPRDQGYSRSYNYGPRMSQEPHRDHGYGRSYSYGQSMSQEPPRDHGYSSRYNYGPSMSYEPTRDHGYRYNNYGRTMVHEPPPADSGYRTNRARPIGPEFRPEAPPPVQVSHSYNSYQPSPYVTGYEYIRSPPRYTQYTARPEHYSEDYQYGNNGGNGTISSVFSDENPNACTIA